MALVLVLIALFALTVPADASSEQTLVVDLFEALPATTSVQIRGPFMLVKPTPERRINGMARVEVLGGKVTVKPVKARAYSGGIAAGRIVVVAIGGRGLGITYPAKEERHYRGEVEVSVDGGWLHLRNRVLKRD